MPTRIDRRHLLQTFGAVLLAAPAAARARQGHPASWRMPGEGLGTPKICLGFYMPVDDANIRRVKQIGVDHVLMGGPRIPWEESEIRARIERFKAGGLTLYNMMISGFDDVIFGPARSRRADRAGDCLDSRGRKGGLPVIEYNFYANRLMEGYKEEKGRAGAGYTAYDYELSKSLPPKDGVGTHTRAEQLKRAEHFLKAIVPEAEKANVRLALHPNDPPVPISRGSEQIMATVDHWKQYSEPGQEPVQRHDLRLRRHTRDGGGSGRGLPLSRRARRHQPRPLPQCRGAEAVCRLHGSLHRRGTGRHVRGDEGTGAAEVSRGRSIPNIRAPSILIATAAHPNQYPGGGGFAGEIYNVGYARAMLQAALTR